MAKKSKNFGGFSFKRLFGLSSAKSKASRLLGVPFTKSGRQRKAGAGSFLSLIASILLGD